MLKNSRNEILQVNVDLRFCGFNHNRRCKTHQLPPTFPYSFVAGGNYCATTEKKMTQKDKCKHAMETYLHNPRSLLLSRAVLARFTHPGLSWLDAVRAGELSSIFLFLLVSFAPFLGVLLALAESSSDTSPLPACFPFFFASPPFLLLPPLDATGLAGGFLLLGDGPLACKSIQNYSISLVRVLFKLEPFSFILLILSFPKMSYQFAISYTSNNI